ncbi:PREDICTED: uncharacterized protein LOC100633167 isoform X1 [Amphimedon queenslandica]|uniref:DOMON domain-containing protein n=1 Tax=Amphimedon queenslandica TaxID=400682 RepID=A0A1X7V5K2_AMPQE|nr:PREDICTED: uncharacterized protein LOC100633167 isoform X1 [Amphimedon queenslandica]|eukprot:XP_003385548.3 PREDICTED: uncharacterized protein LOC100633167 isoform X1 [Amphimedon queenslandica]
MQGLLVLAFLTVFFVATNALVSNCTCKGELSMGTYSVSWMIRDNNRSLVDFNVSVNTDANTWVAVGFSEDRFMPITDVAIGADNGTDSFVEDRWNNGTRSVGPIYDTEQNFIYTSTSRYNDMLTISFTRPIDSPDDTQDLDLTQCRYVLWAYGGSVSMFPSMMSDEAASGLTRHTMRGVFSKQICLCPANETCPTAAPPSTEAPTSSAFSVANFAIITFIFILIAAIF